MEVFKIIEDFVGIILYEVILNKFNWLVQIKDVVLCRIYRKAVSQKSMEQGAMPNYVEREEAELVSRDEYEEKSHSINCSTAHGSF